jgi:hypothetical protein
MSEDPFLPESDSEPDEATPWGFRITLVAAALYLLWRLVEGAIWLWDWISGV